MSNFKALLQSEERRMPVSSYVQTEQLDSHETDFLKSYKDS
jgi:hypothetical protein